VVPNTDNMFFSSSKSPDCVRDPPSLQCVPGTFLPALNLPGLQDNHKPSATVKVTNEWSFLSTPKYVTLCFVRGQFCILVTYRIICLVLQPQPLITVVSKGDGKRIMAREVIERSDDIVCHLY
jgi:hypothetical protein